MQIHVVGYYDMKNVGDEAFRPAIANFFKAHEVRFFNIDLYRKSPPPTPDVIVLGGGDVVTPYYLPTITASASPVKIALGVGLGYESESDLAAQAGFSAWFLRNQRDVDLVRNKTNCVVEYTPDLAFAIKPSGEDVLSRYAPKDKPVVAVFLTDYMMPSRVRSDDTFWRRSQKFLESFGRFCTSLQKRGYQVVCVPCSGDAHADDRRVHLSLRSYVNNDLVCVNDLLSPQEVVDLLADSDAAVCQRFHSHVFAMSANTPIMSVGFTRKVRKLVEAAGHGVLTECFSDGGEYIDVDFDSAFDQIESEAGTQSAGFASFVSNNRELLEVVRRKVNQLIPESRS
jgi:polysaccharide pyruvyl transferase WcaK-like protein